MDVQHQQTSRLLSALPTLDAAFDDSESSQNRVVLQERSANWPHDYIDTNTSPIKTSNSPIPTENVYDRHRPPAGAYFTGNVHAQHIGLAGFTVERSEKQIRVELERLYKLLGRSDKYQKYREKQPQLTPAEFIAREAAEKKAAESRGSKDEKEKSVWPEFLERAFWRALVKWPPMGRKKYMLDGALRGRNELIQDSIRKDTGITRCRKQVSSHLQVLKQHLRDQKEVLVYMATKEDHRRRHRAVESAQAYHMAQARGRHLPHRAPGSKYDFDPTTQQLWAASYGSLQSNFALGAGLNGAPFMSPYVVTEFMMLVEDDDQPVHYFTQLSSNGRLGDLFVADTDSWRRQYPEFKFLKTQPDEWTKENRKLLVCDASIKIMTEARPNANLSITFNLHSQLDLSVFDSLVCTTRFFDSGDNEPDPQFDNPTAQDLKEHRTPCDYMTDVHGTGGRLRIAFGSKFWVNRMLKYQSLRNRTENGENSVNRSLLHLTATQDVYGIEPVTGSAQCVLTILWRFTRTRSSAEVGSMNWRAVSFGSCQPSAEDTKWAKDEDVGSVDLDLVDNEGDEEGADDANLFHQSSQMPMGFSHAHAAYPSYAVQPAQQPQLSLDILASMQPDLEHTSASATTTATDYSQQSMSLSHGQDQAPTYTTDHDFDFNGNQLSMAAGFEPAINLSPYQGFSSHENVLEGLHALAGLDGDGLAGLGLTVNANNELVAVSPDVDVGASNNMSCYSTKPNWAHANLISSLENAAESYHTYLENDDQEQTSHGVLQSPRGVYDTETNEELVAQGLHDSHVNINPGLWSLQSPFHEDTSSGAAGDAPNDCRGEKNGVGLGLGVGMLDMIERDRRAQGY